MSGKGALIVGCGFTGCELAQRLAFGGRAVFGTTRSDQRSSVIRSRGAEPVLVDAEDWSPLRRLRGRVDVAVSCIPPRMERDGSWVDGTAALLEELADFELRAFVYVSSTSVYGDHGGEAVDERTPPSPDSPRGKARLEIEGQVLGSSLPAMVVRPAGIYGPGRSQLHRMAAGRLRLVDGGESVTNRIHVHDLAAIIEAALDRGKAGSVYLGADRRPATQREVTDDLVATYALPQPVDLSLAEARVRMTRDVLAMVTGSKRLDPSWTLERLGLELRYPDWRSGLAAIWRHEDADIQSLLTGDGAGA